MSKPTTTKPVRVSLRTHRDLLWLAKRLDRFHTAIMAEAIADRKAKYLAEANGNSVSGPSEKGANSCGSHTEYTHHVCEGKTNL